MSCYMVSEKTLNVVVCGLLRIGIAGAEQRIPFPGDRICVDTEESARKLFDKIYALNRKAVKDRYPDKWKELMPKRKHKFDPDTPPTTLVQFYKSLGNLTYQLSDAHGKQPLYDALSEYEEEIAFATLESTTDYANASWDL